MRQAVLKPTWSSSIGARHFPGPTTMFLIATCGLLQLTDLAETVCSAETTTRPNIILILADDMGWSDLGCYGSEIATPHLDRLANRGLRWTQMHNTSKCFPSRACLLSGLYAQQCGMARRPSKLRGCLTLGEALRLAGYRTLAVGKHHGTENLFHRGFDHYRGLRDGGGNYFNPGKQRPGEGLPAQKRREGRTWCFDQKTVKPFTPKDPDFYSTDAFTDWALELLQLYQDEPQPFFLYLAYQAPHDPLQAWPADIAQYAGVYDVGYDSIRQARYRKQQQLGLIDETFPLSEPTYPDWESLSPAKRADQARRMQVYAAMIHCMDRNIGRIVQWLEGNGKLQNTVIFFASDNGASAEVVEKGTGEIGSMTRWASQKKDWANVSNTPFRFYKNSSYEGGICTPLIVFAPSVTQDKTTPQKPNRATGTRSAGQSNPRGGHGRIVHQVCHLIDIMPTLLALAGGRYPQRHQNRPLLPLAGQSLVPLIRGEAPLPPRTLFWRWAAGRAVYQEGYKLVSRGQRWELYHLATDRTEVRNLIDEFPQRAEAMKMMHANWLDQCRRQVAPSQ